jgi:hypothetical protein
MPRATILDSINLASVETLAALADRGRYGATWYAESEPHLRARAAALGVDAARYVSVLAITSPRVRVARNVRLTEEYLQHGDAGRLRCLPGVRAGLAHYERTGVVRGPKVGPFARALSGDLGAVVVDTWIARAFVPKRGKVRADRSTVERYQNALTTVAGHREAARRIGAAGRLVGLCPRDAQAAVWHGVYRGTAPSLLDILSTLV